MHRYYAGIVVVGLIVGENAIYKDEHHPLTVALPSSYYLSADINFPNHTDIGSHPSVRTCFKMQIQALVVFLAAAMAQAGFVRSPLRPPACSEHDQLICSYSRLSTTMTNISSRIKQVSM
jgi:hypothetical protein